MTMSSSFAAVKEVSLFYAPTCPYCHYAKDFLFGTLAIEYPFVQFAQKNVQEPSNRGEFEKQLKKCKLDSYGIPLVVIGDKCFQGFAKGTTEKEYREALDISLSEKEKEIVEQAKAELAANPAAARKENAERVARAKAENIDVEKQNGNGLLYGLLGVLAAALLAVILFPKKKK
jgi:glutaredoxin